MTNDELQALVRDELFVRARTSGRARRCGLLPPIADYGFLSDCHTDALVAPGTCPNMTIIVSDGKTPVAAGAEQ